MKIIKFITCCVIVVSNLAAHNALAESSVWKVSKGEDYFYLGGTIHMLNESDHPLPEEFRKAYQDAGEIFFETDLTSTQTPEFQSKFMAAMTYIPMIVILPVNWSLRFTVSLKVLWQNAKYLSKIFQSFSPGESL